MPDTGWVSPGTVVNADRNGATAWNTPENAISQDDQFAYTFSVSSGVYTDWLRATNFGFSIPVGATIDGIEVRFDKFASAINSIQDSSLRLRKSTGQVGDDKADTETYWDGSDTDTYTVYGGASDNWNAGLIYSDINDSNFGVDLSAYHAAGLRNARVDHVQIKVYYTEGGAAQKAIDKSMINSMINANINGRIN